MKIPRQLTGRELKKIMGAHCITAHSLAVAAGISNTWLSAILNDRQQTLPKSYNRVADALEILIKKEQEACGQPQV